jgi:hypothetical protein
MSSDFGNLVLGKAINLKVDIEDCTLLQAANRPVS